MFARGRLLIKITIAASATLFVGCGAPPAQNETAKMEPIEAEAATEVETSYAKQGDKTLQERADMIGVSLALAESWERAGIHIADNGTVYSQECPPSGVAQIPAGINILC